MGLCCALNFCYELCSRRSQGWFARGNNLKCTAWASLYWKALDEMSPFALLSYRVVFSTVSVTFILLARKELKCLLLEIKWKDVSLHGAAAILVACNWGVFIWASIHSRVFESGLGYLIAPLFGIGLGLVFYKEGGGKN